ncbi:MAG: DUF2752 domain-containing protein [Myxococcaceae bacterium]|nr:DUF2752 domain-containing protein [Myxococcaceae bacterium]
MSAAVDRIVTWRILMQPALQPAARVLAFVILVASFVFTPGPLGPDLCPLHRWTGLPCPGCGVTRGLMHVSHGELSLALGANPWALVLWPVLVALALSVVAPARWMARFDAAVARVEPWPSRLVRVLLLAFLGFGFARLGYFLVTGEPFP